MKQVVVYPCGHMHVREEMTPSKVLNYVLNEPVISDLMTLSERVTDFPTYMYITGGITTAYLNGIITKAEARKTDKMLFMLRYGMIIPCNEEMTGIVEW